MRVLDPAGEADDAAQAVLSYGLAQRGQQRAVAENIESDLAGFQQGNRSFEEHVRAFVWHETAEEYAADGFARNARAMRGEARGIDGIFRNVMSFVRVLRRQL